MAVSNVSDRNYLNMLGTAGKDKVEGNNAEGTSHKYKVEYTTGEEGTLGFTDFLTLMIKQLTNQDFTNPTNDSEFMQQMTQFSSLQAMQELASASKNNYAISMVGKTVTASKYSNGTMIKETGVVEQIFKKDEEYQVMVNGKPFTLKQIQSVGTGEIVSGDTEENENEPGQTVFPDDSVVPNLEYTAEDALG